MGENGAYLTRSHIGTGHCEQLRSGDSSVFWVDPMSSVRKQIVDREGNISCFPGIRECAAFLSGYAARPVEPIVRYEASFKKCEDGRFKMLWTVRPDGRYWMDSWGFGAEDYEAVTLYTYIDENGEFTGPFALYSIGSRVYGCQERMNQNEKRSEDIYTEHRAGGGQSDL